MIEIHETETGWFNATVETLPFLSGYGQTRDEALRDLRESLVETMAEHTFQTPRGLATWDNCMSPAGFYWATINGRVVAIIHSDADGKHIMTDHVQWPQPITGDWNVAWAAVEDFLSGRACPDWVNADWYQSYIAQGNITVTNDPVLRMADQRERAREALVELDRMEAE